MDASSQIGSGHVMRCLTLADVLMERGVTCLFIMRKHPGHLQQQVLDSGHDVIMLPEPSVLAENDNADESSAHASWLGVGWDTDARETLESIASDTLDFLVVDHYALDYRWESFVSQSVGHLMVIDDLADRKHECDVLLDQNLGRETSDYGSLVPSATTKLIGARYALLRPEFKLARRRSLAARTHREPCSLFVSMGGVDRENVTANVLHIIEGIAELSGWNVTVVLGSACPHVASVSGLAETMSLKTRVIVNAGNMSELMTEADLAIGAAGGSAWERCCLGLPALLVVMAENQRQGTHSLESLGAALSVGAPYEIGGTLAPSLRQALVPGELARMSGIAAGVCDGNGADRVVDVLMKAIA
ncbi:UDP-2,4-diacetamido-2,4,6-trideoxy-beta-L-altropyranose hydrolase [Marinobacter salinexigens]|uniref:UDP-2,4-diacetamido-2,4, 6-trideoxy-beta-L-altropyranose hydrolase n=1 Tax=Marinobacter salinexigens TaxID=2919747 RepID=UPI001FE52212|nr:UDP-2,4-diacetamido-2,4,6-trideoxy-beta-L-altropyranose hydrolase [Marinobacter salinexigens]